MYQKIFELKLPVAVSMTLVYKRYLQRAPISKRPPILSIDHYFALCTHVAVAHCSGGWRFGRRKFSLFETTWRLRTSQTAQSPRHLHAFIDTKMKTEAGDVSNGPVAWKWVFYDGFSVPEMKAWMQCALPDSAMHILRPYSHYRYLADDDNKKSRVWTCWASLNCKHSTIFFLCTGTRSGVRLKRLLRRSPASSIRLFMSAISFSLSDLVLISRSNIV